MVLDHTRNLDQYKCFSNNFKTAIEFIQSLELSNLAPCDLKIDGDNVFGFVKDFPLKQSENVQFEAHRRYADIQLLLEGRETIYTADTNTLAISIPYDSSCDIAFYHDGTEQTLVELVPLTFGIYFPWDAHKPCCRSGDATVSRKLVVKVLL